MREFHPTYLYRATAISDNYCRSRRTFYMVAAHEREAEATAKRLLKAGEELSGKPRSLAVNIATIFSKNNESMNL